MKIHFHIWLFCDVTDCLLTKVISIINIYFLSGSTSAVNSQEMVGCPLGRLVLPAQDRVTELPSVVIVWGRGSSVSVMFGSARCFRFAGGFGYVRFIIVN